MGLYHKKIPASASTAMGYPEPSDACFDSSDRSEVAARLLDLAPLIRRRLRDRLSATDRRLFDTQDLMSTILRRVDALIATGRLRAETDIQLVSLVLTVLDNAVVDRHRVLARLRRVESEDGVWAAWLIAKLEDQNPEHTGRALAEVFESVESDDDRLFLSLRLSGATHAMIAELIGISHDACRQRWVSIKNHILAQLESHERHSS